MLIEDEPLAHELEWQSGEKDQVWRIAGLDDRKAALAVNLEQEAEFMEQRGRIFAEVSKRAAPLGRQGMPVDRDVVDDLERLRKVGVGRADHRHCPAGAMEGLSLLPNPSIEGDRQVFNDDDTGAGLARGWHGRLSIVGICGFVGNTPPHRAPKATGARYRSEKTAQRPRPIGPRDARRVE